MYRRSSLLLAAGLLVASTVWGQTAQDVAAAQALFDEGRRLLASGNYAAACDKFEASQKWDPGVGTLLNLADCYEKSGRFASAWAVFLEAASAAENSRSPVREEVARSRARALATRYSTLNIRAPSGLRLFKDGKLVDPAMLGTPIPVDPGKHVIEASAPGKKPWKEVVDVPRNQIHLEVIVPERDQAGSSESQATSLSPAAASGSARTAPSAPASSVLVGASAPVDSVRSGATPSGAFSASSSAMSSGAGNEAKSRLGQRERSWAIGAGLAGLAGLGVSAAFAIHATSLWADAKTHCGTYLSNCDPTAERLSSDALQSGNVATAAFLVGMGGVAAGVVLWFWGPREKDATPENVPSRVSNHTSKSGAQGTIGFSVAPNSVVVRGAF